MIPLRYNLRSLTVRKTSSIATIVGIALVVFVLSSSLMLGAGISKTLASSGKEDVAIVLRQGADNEMGSSVEDPKISLIKAMPGIKQGPEGALVAPEVVVVAALEKLGAQGVANVLVRGVQPDVFKFRPEAKIVAGRAPQPGADEAIIGHQIRGRFKGLDLDQSFEMKKNRPVKIVGVFTTGGSSHDSEIWSDVEIVRQAFGRQGIVSTVRAKLASPGQFDGFKLAVEQDKRLGLQAMRENKFYEKQSEGTSIFITAIGVMVSFFFSLGAMIGAMITMYAAVANRQREIGTLRALGFSRFNILFAFLIESLALSLVGGLVGLLASFAMKFVRFSMMNFASWSEMVFTFEPTASTLGVALVFALSMGLLGGFLPAIRASRVSPVAAMRG